MDHVFSDELIYDESGFAVCSVGRLIDWRGHLWTLPAAQMARGFVPPDEPVRECDDFGPITTRTVRF